MVNTFTSTETISSTITSIKGMIDALRKDQLELQENMSSNNSDLKTHIEEFRQLQKNIILMGEKALSEKGDTSKSMIDEVRNRIQISKEWLNRSDNLLYSHDISEAIKRETRQIYSNKTDIDRFINKVWFDSLKVWLSLDMKIN